MDCTGPPPSGAGRYEQILETIPQLVWVAGPDGGLEYLNRTCREYAGLPLDDMLGWDWGWITHPADLPHTLTVWNEALRTGAPVEVEFRLRRHDGEYRWFLSRGCPYRDKDGQIIRWYGTCTDIDDIKKTQLDLRATQKLFRALVERSELGFALIGADRVVRYVSPTAARLMGHQLEDVIGQDSGTHAHPDDLVEMYDWFDRLLAAPGEQMRFSLRFRRKDGTYRKLRIWASNLLPDPDVRAVAVVFREDEDGE